MLSRLSSLFLVLLFFGCSNKKVTEAPKQDYAFSFKAEDAPEWTSLFTRSKGWFGGDGIYAIPYSGDDNNPSGDSILFLFSDSMVGEIDNNVLKPGYEMVNNSVMVLQGRKPAADRASFQYKVDGKNKPTSLFLPSTPQAHKDDYYWLGDGFVNAGGNGALYFFGYRIRNTNDGSLFPFKVTGNNLIAIPKGEPFPYAHQTQYEIPFYVDGDASTSLYGAAVLDNTKSAGAINADGFIYVYSIRGNTKDLVVARVTPAALTQFNAWEFYDGSGWTKEPSKASAIADSVSNELSITPIAENRYALIYQTSGLSSDIMMQIGSSPVGPFGPAVKVWDTSAETKVKDFYAYNAKAHPAISAPGELIVSYNVNSFNFFDHIVKTPYLYHPHFFRIVFTNPSGTL